ncbi:type II toxin-antitoxin system death-on-curing family toxin [Patescibacteria group bacterium]|nr:MAG: type II toxin-antitoxin system death-on-curing family toxin [Patescibacteria group bacterium]
MVYLTVEDIKNICFEYARAHLAYDEPLPSFETRFPNRLEAALAVLKQSFSGTPVYPKLSEQAAVLFYEMVKQHPFLNGNKRLACVSFMTFLSLNEKWVRTSWKSLYDIAVTVANSRTENREGVLSLLKEFIENNLYERGH